MFLAFTQSQASCLIGHMQDRCPESKDCKVLKEEEKVGSHAAFFPAAATSSRSSWCKIFIYALTE